MGDGRSGGGGQGLTAGHLHSQKAKWMPTLAQSLAQRARGDGTGIFSDPDRDLPLLKWEAASLSLAVGTLGLFNSSPCPTGVRRPPQSTGVPHQRPGQPLWSLWVTHLLSAP